jgi:hypothetical protein
MQSFQAKVECPRCGKVWTVQQGETEIQCNCHTYCEDGSKPSDCSLTPVTLNHEVGWPYGVHTGGSGHDDYPLQAQYWCSVHERFGFKVPVVIEVDWDKWRVNRAPKRFRLLQR